MSPSGRHVRLRTPLSSQRCLNRTVTLTENVKFHDLIRLCGSVSCKTMRLHPGPPLPRHAAPAQSHSPTKQSIDLRAVFGGPRAVLRAAALGRQASSPPSRREFFACFQIIAMIIQGLAQPDRLPFSSPWVRTT